MTVREEREREDNCEEGQGPQTVYLANYVKFIFANDG
jgi:hypothetical protein